MLFLLHVILTYRESIVPTGSQALRYLGGMDEFRIDRLNLLGGASAHPSDEEGDQPLGQQTVGIAHEFDGAIVFGAEGAIDIYGR